MCDGWCFGCSRSNQCDEDAEMYPGEHEDTDELSLRAMSHCQNDQDVDVDNSEC